MYGGPSPSLRSQNSAMQGAVESLSLILGLVVALWLVPMIYGLTIDEIVRIGRENYGPHYQTLIEWTWFLLLYPLVVLVTRILCSLSFTMLTTLLSARMF